MAKKKQKPGQLQQPIQRKSPIMGIKQNFPQGKSPIKGRKKSGKLFYGIWKISEDGKVIYIVGSKSKFRTADGRGIYTNQTFKEKFRTELLEEAEKKLEELLNG